MSLFLSKQLNALLFAFVLLVLADLSACFAVRFFIFNWATAHTTHGKVTPLSDLSSRP